MHLFYMKVSRFSSGLQHYSLKTYYLAASRVVSCSKFVQFIYSLPRNNLKYRCVRQSLDQRLCCARARKLLGYGFPGIKKGGGGGGGGVGAGKKRKKNTRDAVVAWENKRPSRQLERRAAIGGQVKRRLADGAAALGEPSVWMRETDGMFLNSWVGEYRLSCGRVP